MGPGLEVWVEVAAQFLDRIELEVRDSVLVGGDLVGFEVDHVNDAEVDLAYAVRIVIE